MIRGRIMAVNDQPLPTAGEMEEGPRQRETNLTWSTRLPTGNVLTAGEWWPDGTNEALVSVEAEFAQRMGVEVGDKAVVSRGCTAAGSDCF